jgi:hypothetical protein
MDITIGNILAFLVILFAINGVATGLGVTDQSKLNTFNVFGTDTNVDNLTTKYNDGNLIIVGSINPDLPDTATTDSDIITGVPFTPNITTQTATFWDLLGGLMVGYASLIILLPIGSVMTFILIGIIGFMQFGAIIYLLLYVFSIIRGGGGI